MELTIEELELIKEWFTYFSGETTVLDDRDEWHEKDRELFIKIHNTLIANGKESYNYFE